MNLKAQLLIALAALALTAQVAAAECTEWNTLAFFQSTTLEEVIDCLNAGAEVTPRDESGRTPLHDAAFFDTDPAIITALTNAGAEVEARDRYGHTPLPYLPHSVPQPRHHAPTDTLGPSVVIRQEDQLNSEEALRGPQVEGALRKLASKATSL